MLHIPNFDLELLDLGLLLASMLSFLLFIWASKKVLDFLGLEDFKIGIEAREQMKKEDKRRKIQEYKKNYREKQALKKKNKESKATENKRIRKSKRESISSIQKRLDIKNSKKYVTKGGNKLRTKTGRVITHKPRTAYNPNTFMSKKYRDTVTSGKFNKKRTQRRFHF